VFKKTLQKANNSQTMNVMPYINFAQRKPIMNKCIAILLLTIFSIGYWPGISRIVKAEVTCMADMGEDGPLEKAAEKNKCKKDLKELFSSLRDTPQQATAKFSFYHNSHFLGDNPAADVLTPPPNQI
jgi:hypothetical protein